MGKLMAIKDNYKKAMFYQKIEANLRLAILKYIIRTMYYGIIKKENASIPIGMINESTILPHGLSGIYISNGASIGKNCVIYHRVTIGSNTIANSKNMGAPIIGDNVYIGTGAAIIGGIKIGNNVRIGANCVVITDVPDNSTVVMQKPRIIEHNSILNNEYIPYKNLDLSNVKIE